MEISKRKRACLFLLLNILIINSANLVYSNTLEEDLKKNNINLTEKIDEFEIDKNLYFLGPGDELFINFLSNPDFSEDMKIISDGSISLPIIGTININGLSIDQATSKIQNQLAKELLRPEIQIILIKPRPINVAVIGEVKRPGFYSLEVLEQSSVDRSRLKLTGYPTLFSAIQKAGGVTSKTDLRNIVLIRKIDGKGRELKKTNLNLIETLNNGDTENNPILFDGDRIKLKKAELIDKNDLKIVKSNLYPNEISVTVIGEVNDPGTFNIPAVSSLNQSIMYAKGPIDWAANKGNVQILSINEDGSASVTKHKVNLSENISKNNPLIKDGDIIKVNSNLLSKSTKAINAIASPFDGIIKGYGLFKLFSE